MSSVRLSLFFFFFNDTATTEIYTLSLHDALPISDKAWSAGQTPHSSPAAHRPGSFRHWCDRESECPEARRAPGPLHSTKRFPAGDCRADIFPARRLGSILPRSAIGSPGETRAR